MRDVWTDYHWKKLVVYELWNLYKEDVAMNIPMTWWGRGGSIHLCSSGILYQQLYDLWRTGHENYKSGLHISL